VARWSDMISEAELKNQRRAARKGFLAWQAGPMVLVVFVLLVIGNLMVSVDKPASLGVLLTILSLFIFALWLALRLLDRYEIVRGLIGVWKALRVQKNDFPPSTALFDAVDQLRRSLVLYVKSSRGHYFAVDLHIPQLRRDMDLSFALISELMHMTAWKRCEGYNAVSVAPVESAPSRPPYEFLMSWTSRVSRQLLEDRKKGHLLESRIVSLSYLFEETLADFKKNEVELTSRCSAMVNEAFQRQQERQRWISEVQREVLVVVVSAAVGGMATYLVAIL